MPIQPLQLPGAFQSPSIDFQGSLAALGQTYQRNQNQQKLADIGKGLADGSLDYRTAAGQIAQTGDLDGTYKFLQLAEAERKRTAETAAGKSFADSIAPYLGGGGAPASAPVPSTMQMPANPVSLGTVPAPQPLNTRAPVASSATIWGDDEGVAKGIYEPKPGQAAPPLQSLASLAGPRATTNGTPNSPMAPAPSPRQAASMGGTTDPRSVAPQVMAQNSELAAPPTSGMRLPPASALISAMANPNMPTAQKEIAGKLLTRVLDESKMPEKIQTLNMLKQQSGYQGTILELEKEMRAAGKTDVNIDQKGETEEAKAAGKGAGERRATMFASAGAASKTLVNLTRTESLLNQVSQGKLEPGRMNISAWAKALGMNDDVATSLGLDPKGVGSAQALSSLVNESVIGKIGAGGFPANNFSDADREFITGIFPRLGDDPAANKIRIEGARRIANLDIQRAKDYQIFKANPANKGKGFEDFEVDFSDKVAKQDMFGDLRKQAEAIIGPARTDIGSTLSNPGRAPQQQPQGNTTTRQGVKWSVQ